jgi:hypothetical protein
MRRRSLARLGALAVCLSIGCSVLACADSLPAEPKDSLLLRFALSEASAQAFEEALDDVRSRILPALSGLDASHSLAPLLDDFSSALTARDQIALRRVLTRTESIIAQLEQGDAAAAAIGSELDAVRLILEEARPLAQGETTVIPR